MDARGEPQQGLERGHRGASAVEPKGELVQVGLEVIVTDAVMGAGPSPPSAKSAVRTPCIATTSAEAAATPTRAQLRDGLGAPAQAAESHGEPRAGSPQGQGRGRRDVPGRSRGRLEGGPPT